MENQILLNVSIKKEPEGGYSVVCTDLDVASQGETVEEAMENIKEAVELYLESAEELDIIDDVLDRLGITREDLKKGVSVPKIFRAEIPVRLSG
jgi:predicted RNase H-like HicB family nuclease